MVRARQSRLLAQVLKKFLQGTRFYFFMTKQFVAVFPLDDSTHQMCHCDRICRFTAKAPSIAIFSLSLRVAGTNWTYGVVGALGWRMNPKRGLLNQKSRP
jgi:hypothetical protein